MRARWSCSQKLCPILVLWSMEKERKYWGKGPQQDGFQAMVAKEVLYYEADCTRSIWLLWLCPQHPTPYQMPGGGEMDMWRRTLGSSPPPGQPLMAQGGLDFQSGWSHGCCNTHGHLQALPVQYPEPSADACAPADRCTMLH